MPGARHRVQDAAAQVDGPENVEIVAEAEELAYALRRGVHDHRVRAVAKLAVARDVVAVAVRVGDDEPVVLAGVIGQPAVHDLVHRPAQREVRG
ncbi:MULTISPECIES: hypothetical protein [unclassified Microbispora]|uniref:hypothetical protein n=1 Tax=Microbispora sp. CL1-1 TaxID=2720026 RepID=UPI001F0E688D|nr:MULTISPECIES: hypothetical protein [unclassified Microbispora]